MNKSNEILIKQIAAKRVQIVEVKLVRETSLKYKERKIRSPMMLINYFMNLLATLIENILCLDTKNQPTYIQTVHIGSLNASIVHSRESIKVMKSLLMNYTLVNTPFKNQIKYS